MAGTKKVASVGVRQLQICPRPLVPDLPVWLDVPSVTDASFKMAVSEVEQWGDDVLQNTFYHSQKGTIAVKSTTLALAVLEQISGNPVTSAGATEMISIGLATEVTPPRLAMRVRIANVKQSDGTNAEILSTFYNCSVKTAFESIPEASLGKLQEVALNFNVYFSNTDEEGSPLADYAFGRLEIGASIDRNPSYLLGAGGVALTDASGYFLTGA